MVNERKRKKKKKEKQASLYVSVETPTHTFTVVLICYPHALTISPTRKGLLESALELRTPPQPNVVAAS